MANRRLETLCIPPTTRLGQVLARIDLGGLGFVVVTDEKRRLLGTVTDGDVRRALLSDAGLDQTAAEFMNAKCRTIPQGSPREEWQSYLLSQRITFAPVVDAAGLLVDIAISDHLPGKSLEDVAVVVMAGGLGSRLGEHTREVPKPMLQIDGEPILERIVKRFRDEGFDRFIFCTNYKSEVIEAHFGDGAALGVRIDFVVEQKRLGTGGALSLIDSASADRFFVTNADILCTTSYREMLDFHIDQKASATMAVREHVVQVPFGVVETDGFEIRSIREKPHYTHFINAGYYVLERHAVDAIPHNEYFDLPSLFDVLRASNRRTRVFPTSGDWIDIGRPEDLVRARSAAGSS